MKAGGTDGLKDASPLANKLQEVYSSVEVWKNDFFKVGAMRGVGWAVLFQDPETKTVSNHWITLHEEGNVAGFVETLSKHVGESAEIIVLEGSDHGFTGYEEELGKLMAEWMEG